MAVDQQRRALETEPPDTRTVERENQVASKLRQVIMGLGFIMRASEIQHLSLGPYKFQLR